MRHSLASVRDRLWLLGHDDYGDLRPVIDTRALGIGLAAAALVDLLLQDRIEVNHGLIYLTPSAPDAPGGYRTSETSALAQDPISSEILALLDRGPAPRLAEVLHEARTEAFGNKRTPFQRLYQRTRTALVKAEYLREQPRRVRPNLYHLNNPNLISSLRGAVSHRLAMYHKCDPNLSDDSLLALVWALNLHLRLPMAYSPSEAEPILHAITERIPARAGSGSPLTILPHLTRLVGNTIGDLATAAF